GLCQVGRIGVLEFLLAEVAVEAREVVLDEARPGTCIAGVGTAGEQIGLGWRRVTHDWAPPDLSPLPRTACRADYRVSRRDRLAVRCLPVALCGELRSAAERFSRNYRQAGRASNLRSRNRPPLKAAHQRRQAPGDGRAVLERLSLSIEPDQPVCHA